MPHPSMMIALSRRLQSITGSLPGRPDTTVPGAVMVTGSPSTSKSFVMIACMGLFEDATCFLNAAQEAICTVFSCGILRCCRGLAVPARLQAGAGGSTALGTLGMSYADGHTDLKADASGSDTCSARSKVTQTRKRQLKQPERGGGTCEALSDIVFTFVTPEDLRLMLV